MKKHKRIPSAYAECFWLTPQDLCSIMQISQESCSSLLNQIYDKGTSDCFEVHRFGRHYKIGAESFWNWFDENRCWVED